MEQMIRSIGVLAFVVIGISLWMVTHFHIKPKKLPEGFRLPMVALQLVRSKDKVGDIVGDRCDFTRGGAWSGKSKDPMHFQFCSGY